MRDAVTDLKGDSDNFIEALLLHEVLHHLFGHKALDEKMAKVEDEAVHNWMREHTSFLEYIFNMGMFGTVEAIQKRYIKTS